MAQRILTSLVSTGLSDSSAFTDRRMHRRYEFTATIEIGESGQGSRDVQNAGRIDARVSDLGKRGCFVNTPRPFPVGTIVKARITQAKKSCDVHARVIYSLAGQGMGLMFTDADPEQLRTLEAWLAASREASWFASTRRRSQRVVMKIPVKVFSADEANSAFEEDTHTLVINAHGASFLLSRQINKGEQLFLRNRQTSAMQECTIVHVGNPQGNPLEVAVEFLVPNPTFWQVIFPPEDWTPGIAHVKTRA
jgi:hypothetical protein